MQKLLFALLFSFAATALFAQDLDEINDLISKSQWDKAKAGIDKYLSNPKKATDANGWYFKGLIYNEIAKSAQFSSLSPDARMEAFNAFKKTLELEPKNVRMTLEQHVRLFDIYNGYFDAGAKYFNEKKFDDAYTSFKHALTVEEYIAKNNFTYNNFSFPKFDTSLIQNIALSAYSAKKDDEAAVWYQKMAEQKIGGKEYLDIYQFLVEHYNKKKDLVNREKYLQLGRELYPENDYWCLVALNDVDDKDKAKLFAKYEEVLGTDCGKRYSLSFNYAVELFNYAYTGESKPANYVDIQNKLENILINKTLAANNTAEANMLMARHYYNMIYDIQDAQKLIKGTKPEDVKKRAELKTQMIVKVDALVPYALKAFDIYTAKATLKPSERGNYKVVTDILVSAYELKGQKDKAEDYKKKLAAIN